MVRKLMMVTAVMILTGLVLAACVQMVPAPAVGDDGAAQGQEISLYVGPELVDCVGAGPQTCMLVKENQDDEYTYFYDQIEGFEYEPGYEYELRVQVTPVENPPADASSLKYTLIEVVSKTPVDAVSGTEEGGQAELTLEGVNWQAASYVDGEGQSQTPIASAEPTALFENGAVNGTTGCNNYFGSYQVSDNQLTIDENTGMTMMACPDPLMTQEQAYVAALGSVATYAIVDGQLQLSNADGQVVLTYVPLEPVTLTGTTWEAIGYNNGKQAVVSIIIDSQITAVFGEDGTLAGSAGCNNYNASYEADDANIKIGPAAATRKMCADPEGVMEQENLYLAALQMAQVYTIDGDRLQLRTAEGSLVADYRARVEEEAGDELVGPVWAWQGTQSGDDSVTTVSDPSRYTVQFMDDSKVSIKADCNQVSGSYTADDSQLKIEQPMASTMAMCPEDSQDQQFLQELSAAASYVIEEGNLFISMMADAGIMAFAPLQ